MPEPRPRIRGITEVTLGMNTKHITDRRERKRLKREARKRRPPKAKRPAGVARGSHKKKVPKMAKGQRKR